MKRANPLADIARARLNRQLLGEPAGSVAEVTERLCAVQGQDYAASLWAFGARLKKATQLDIEAAIADGTIVRSWPMRGTLHLVHATDLRWMLELLGSEMVARHTRRLRELGVTDALVDQSQKLMRHALAGGARLTRPQLYSVLEGSGIANREVGYHLFWRAALDRVICIGPREGRQATFVLFDEWVPPSPAMEREEGLARLATRYFVGHGPATISDFQWWSGLKAADARAATRTAEGIESLRIGDTEYWFAPGALDQRESPARTFVLPAFDELLVGYRDRTAFIAAELLGRVNAGGGLLEATIVRGGKVVGTWKRKIVGNRASISVSPFTTPTASWKKDVERAFRPWLSFHSLEGTVTYRE